MVGAFVRASHPGRDGAVTRYLCVFRKPDPPPTHAPIHRLPACIPLTFFMPPPPHHRKTNTTQAVRGGGGCVGGIRWEEAQQLQVRFDSKYLLTALTQSSPHRGFRLYGHL